MENYILAFIVAGIIATVIVYLTKAKRKGAKCIGCPYAKSCCSKNCTDKTDN